MSVLCPGAIVATIELVRLSDRGARLIADFEGFRSCPYRDAVGVWTIGYGSTQSVGPRSRCVTREQALARMRREVGSTYGAAVDELNREHKLGLNQSQFDALTSFVYNLGPGAIGPDTGIGKALRAKQWQRAGDEMLRWNKAGGRVLEGLTRRRRAERALFLRRPPVAYTAAEQRAFERLAHGSAHQRRDARAWLEAQASRIRKAAGAGGWDRRDRRRRHAGIRRRLRA